MNIIHVVHDVNERNAKSKSQDLSSSKNCKLTLGFPDTLQLTDSDRFFGCKNLTNHRRDISDVVVLMGKL